MKEEASINDLGNIPTNPLAVVTTSDTKKHQTLAKKILKELGMDVPEALPTQTHNFEILDKCLKALKSDISKINTHYISNGVSSNFTYDRDGKTYVIEVRESTK